MNNMSVFVQHSSNFQYLSVCHYITTLGIIFYNKGLITLNQRNQSIPVLNTYFKYLNNSNNETETKFQLLQIILKGTDLYGGGENETLDTKYVDETYQYIINSALFSHYGNINGYLAKIINKADNTSYSTLMKTIKQEFFNNYTIKDYCSKTNKSPKLNFLSAKTIFFEYILPIFPEPENKDMNIMEVDYLYAMAGLKIVKSILGETLNASFGDLISITREFDLQEAYGNETYEIMLNVFSTPALFFYAFKEKETFREKYQISSNIEFWIEAYKSLFSYINTRMNNFVHQFFDNIPLYKLEKEMKELKNRRLLATTILEKYCTYSHFKNHSSEFVTNYMSYSHIFVKLFLPSGCFLENLPELQVVYENQFKNVQKTYNEIEKIRIKKFIIENNFEEKLNSNVTVMSARVLYDPFRTYNGPLIKKQINKDIYLLFSIQKENNMTEFFAIKEENNNLILLTNSGNEQNFSKAVTNLLSFPIDSGEYSTILKTANENSEAFIERIAEMKTTQFVNKLMEDYKNETTKEKIFNFVKVLVPFYNCIENIIGKNIEDAVMSCSLDVLTLIPVAGFAANYATKITTSLVTRLSEKYVISTTLSSATKFNSLFQIAKLITKTVSQEILTKSLLKDLSITFLRVIDPGLELISSLGKFGYQKLHKIYNTMIQKIPKINTNLKLLLSTMLKKLNMNMKLSTFNGLIPKVLREENNYKLVQYYYPNGENYFGPTCLLSFGNTAELRTIEGSSLQVPVLPVKDNMNKISYREYNPSTNEISNIKLEMGENDLLRCNLPYLEDTKIIPYKFNPETQLKGGLSTDDIPSTSKKSSQLFSTDTLPNVDISGMDRKVLIRRLMPYFNLHEDTKIINDVHIYHNTIEWNKTPNPGTSREIVPSDNILDSSRQSEELILSNLQSKITYGENNYREMLLSLENLKPENYANLYKKKEKLIILQKNLERIRLNQDVMLHKMPTELWFKQTLNRPHIVKYLEQMKGQDFYFNDITLLTDIRPSEINIVNKKSYSLTTEVRYHMTIESQYGLVDLAAFDKSWKNKFAVFPELEFTVVNTEFKNGKDFLLLELKQMPILKRNWLIYRMKCNSLFKTQEISTYARNVDIENAANLISLNTPRHRLTEMEEMLRGYILRIDPIETRVPTYEKMAKEINAGITPPDIFNEWKIKNHIFIDDVLFKDTAYQVKNLEIAKQTINHIFDGTHLENIETVYESYKLLSIRQSMRFEDYYVLYSHLANTLPPTLHAQKSFLASLYRLALRQCDDIIKIPNTLYHAAELSPEDWKELVSLKYYRNRFKINNVAFYSNAEDAVKNTPITNVFNPLLLTKLEIKNPSGIVYIDSNYFQVPKEMYYIPDVINFKNFGKVKTSINDFDFVTLVMQEIEIPKETRMVKLVNKLNELFLYDNFYINLNPRESKIFKNSIETEHPIIREGLPSDNIPSTSRGIEQITSKGNLPTDDFDKKFKSYKEDWYKSCTEILVDFEKNGISGLKDNKLSLYKIRSFMETLSKLQNIIIDFKLPRELWFTDKSVRRTFVTKLEKLKGKGFYFNDLTFLTDVPPIESKKLAKFSLEKEVRFHIKINSQFGLVDLSKFQNTLKNQYIVFPELEFIVENTYYINGNSILQMDLVQKPIEKEKWMKIREENLKLINSVEVGQSIRGLDIEDAAYFISTKTPLHRYTDSKKMLEEYILKTSFSQSSIPSYESLAKEIFAGGSIPNIYSKYKIKNNIFINDVLFQYSLYEVKNLESAQKTIEKIFDGLYIQEVEPVFKSYKKIIGYQNNMRFEDYFVIHSYFSGNLKRDINWQKRFYVALMRLALRQCNKDIIKTPITLYHALNVPNRNYIKILTSEKDTIIPYNSDNPFHETQEAAMKYIPNTNNKKILFSQVELNNIAGIAYIDPHFKFPTKLEYYIPQSLELKKNRIITKTIEGKNVNFILLNVDKFTNEKRMVKLVNNLNDLFLSDIMFYVNDI
ncbi:uncharacterized protein LOC127290128 [Leptopilina boulardi]|uniref:uncharacterized protein LOC127290128 n=1 Tax=Leptopilina boulardi TaxID=63433 RepID=UPI0021F688B2|nr:uncharacterized protein LOC127290128 [Leptopilina boulardi]